MYIKTALFAAREDIGDKPYNMKILPLIVLTLLALGCTESITESVKQESCEEKIKGYIPSEFRLETSSGDWHIVEEDRRWTDGSVMGKIQIYYRKGTKPGENINYYYPSTPLGKADPLFTYEKAVVADDGTILRPTIAFISLVLKPIPGTLNTSGGLYTTQDFEVVDFNFTRCDWAENE